MKDVYFYTHAGPGIGMGHVSRCLVLARELSKKHRCRFIGDSHVADQTARENIETVSAYPLIFPTADVYVADFRGGVPAHRAKQLRDVSDVLVIFDDCAPLPDPARFYADLMIYPGITNRPHCELDWTGFDGEWHEGADWIMLHEKFQNRPPRKRHGNRVVVCGGGSDPLDVTTKILNCLSGLDVCAIIGPSNTQFEPGCYPDVKIVHSPPDMADALEWGDVAIVTYGSTVFESLALGIPVIIVPVFGDQGASADLVAERSGGAVCNLGEIDTWCGADVSAAVDRALAIDGSQRFVDGLGASRVAERIEERLGAVAGLKRLEHRKFTRNIKEHLSQVG